MNGLPPQDPLEPRPAATLVILRPSESGPQVLLTVRPESFRFMGGASVFPGGAIAEADRDLRWSSVTRPRDDAARDEEGIAPLVCALREAFEEVGFPFGDGDLEDVSRAAADDPGRFLEVCLDKGIVLATDRLVAAGRWVTPLGSPVRFDARFFVTEAPEAWEPSPDPAEVAGCRWVTPSEALAELAAGRALMAPPTIEMLQLLDGHATVADAIAAARRRGVGERGSIISARLSPLVHAVLAPNPGLMTGPGTNTYVVGTRPTIVIDPAVDDEVFLETVLAAAGEITAILVTHRHSDHVGGAAALAASSGAPVRAFGGAPAGAAEVVSLGEGEAVTAGGARLVALHTPGHASDHLCFLLEGAASLFSGDTILGEGTAVIAPPDGDMAAYLASLERLRSLAIDRIYPGHFRPLDGGRRVIEGYIDHRRQREEAILSALSGGRASIDAIVQEVYSDTAPSLHPIARFSVGAHLEWLARQGRVVEKDGEWSLGGVE